MSYSIQLRAANKAEALAAVSAKMDEVAKQQTCHERDKQQALAAAEAFINLLDDDATREVSISMAGSLAGTWQGSAVTHVSGASMSFSAGLVPPVPAA